MLTSFNNNLINSNKCKAKAHNNRCNKIKTTETLARVIVTLEVLPVRVHLVRLILKRREHLLQDQANKSLDQIQYNHKVTNSNSFQTTKDMDQGKLPVQQTKIQDNPKNLEDE